MYAFRCKTCGHLHPAEHAGQNEVPHACCVCGAGVTLNPRTAALAKELADPATDPKRVAQISGELLQLARTGENEKHAHPDNWEVLAKCDESRLKELGLSKEDISSHSEFEHERKKYPVLPVKEGAVKGRTLSLGVGATENVGGRG